MPGAPVAPKKSRKGLIFGIIAIVLVVCCGGAIGGGFYLYNKVSDEVTPITDSANSFFAAVRDGGDAYSQLCTSARASISRGQFEQGLQGQPLKAFKIAAVNVVTTNGVKKATATVSLTYADRAETHVVPMANESGGWKVCGSPY
jgi:flagellar basal body-associated protein FliL